MTATKLKYANSKIDASTYSPKPLNNMTRLEFLQTYFPVAMAKSVVEQSQEQNQWQPNKEADNYLIYLSFDWKKTKEGYKFWDETDSLLIENYNVPANLKKLLQAHWNKHHKISPHVEEEQQNKTSMKLDKYAEKTVANVTLVEGIDISDLKPTQLIAMIKGYKKEVKDLEDTGITGAYVTAEKAKATLAIDTLLAELNRRAPEAAPAAQG